MRNGTKQLQLMLLWYFDIVVENSNLLETENYFNVLYGYRRTLIVEFFVRQSSNQGVKKKIHQSRHYIYQLDWWSFLSIIWQISHYNLSGVKKKTSPIPIIIGYSICIHGIGELFFSHHSNCIWWWWRWCWWWWRLKIFYCPCNYKILKNSTLIHN